MRKLILKSFLSPGDIVMMTAAVRDLHRTYPNEFQTDVRTLCPDIWQNNPYLTSLDETEKDVEFIECSYPLIDRCNDEPYHCLHGYIDFLNSKLGLAIKPTEFRGDIHLSELEKSWYSQVYEVTKADIPFWIIVAGGKYDVTIKWWETSRFQKVIDHFRDRIQFVQVGDCGHHHPRLQGVIDLRGQTNLRELIRLVYHAQGVLCPVTAVMHLAASVPYKQFPGARRPCVVIGGGREPAYWEAYPGHQYIHTNGALVCCTPGGCWRDRVQPLGDGDERDAPDHLCRDVVDKLPRCMTLITPEEVIRCVELYFQGGMLNYLQRNQTTAGKRGVFATGTNQFDDQPLSLQSAGLAFDCAAQSLPSYPGGFHGRGIVICGGGIKYFPAAWVCIKMLRHLGCNLPIELWYLGPDEITPEMQTLLSHLQVLCVDAFEVRKHFPTRLLGGWELKPFAVAHSRFREVILLDADNVPVADPAKLFESPEYKDTGAIFWPDYGQLKKTQLIWDSCRLERPAGPEFESGQIIIDKRKCWRALRLALWLNEHSDFYYQHLHGDKETFHLAFVKLGKSFSMPSTPIHTLDSTMCQHDFAGNRIFQHRNTDKWNLFLQNKRVNDFWYEDECRGFIRDLQQRWDGGTSRYIRKNKATQRISREGLPQVVACMISCAERTGLRNQTLQLLAESDWGSRPIHIELDQTEASDRRERQTRTAYLALSHVLQTSSADYILFIEDDIEVNRWLHTNLLHWRPLIERRITLAGLYNPGLGVLACDVPRRAWIVHPTAIFGSQAFIVSRKASRFILRHWNEVEGMQDIKMSRLAGRMGKPIFYHVPSLVQHTGATSTWGGSFHQAIDYDRNWRLAALDPSLVECR